jgi:hypothetical protein
MAQPEISDIERRVRKVTSAEVIERITRGLGVPEELGGLPARSEDLSYWVPPPELRERIARANAAGRPDMRIADWIAGVLATHRRTEDVVGGRDMWPVVRSQLDTVTRQLQHASREQADRLLVLAAEHAHWLSWVADQEGKHGAALAWLDLAHGWAVEAGSYDLMSWVTRVRSHYTLRRDDPVRALRTAEVARQAPGPLSPAAASIAAHAEAMAAAAVAERDRANRLADEALELALRVPDEAARPGWLYWLDPVRARLQRADAAYAVRDWTAAAAGYAAELPALEGFPRDQAYYAARLADARQRV